MPMILNAALLLVELWFLAFLGLALHRLSPRYGLTPIFLMTGALIGIIRVAAPIGVYVRLTPDIVFTVTGNVFVPIILLMVLVIYVADGTIPARITIYSILGAEVFSIGIMLILR